MLDSFEKQVIVAAVQDLESKVGKTLVDPSAQATLAMVCRLLAHVAVRGDSSATGDSEVEALAREETAEDALLAAGKGATPDPLNAESLQPYLRSRTNNDRLRVESVHASVGGFSKHTFIVQLSGADDLGNALVIRRDQAGGPVDSAAADEFPVIALMFKHRVPVAEPLWADANSPFGGTILVTRCVSGSTAFDLSASTLGSQGRAAALDMARVLAKVHSIGMEHFKSIAHSSADTVQQHVHRLVLGYEAQWQRHKVGDSALIAAAFAYLRDNVPGNSSGPAIVHGDASLRNLLLHDEKATALLDWELWHVGDPTEDLAYCRPEVEQMLPWAEFMQEYQAHGGGPYDDKVGAYYELFGALRNVVFGHSCLHGFVLATRPQSHMAFAPVYLARKLMPVIAQRLHSLQA